MIVSILISDLNHPILPLLDNWVAEESKNGHEIAIFTDKKDLLSGDVLFLISCGQILNLVDRQKFKKTLVLHASDLPDGRGWSPHIWAILSGAREIVVSLLEAEQQVDTGAIWEKRVFCLDGTELYDEINDKLFEAELSLMTFAIRNFLTIDPFPQLGVSGIHYRRRTWKDSELNVDKTIAEQFDLMRVADPSRYPAFVEFRGRKYICRLEGFDDE